MNRNVFRVCLLIGALALVGLAAPSAHAQSPCAGGYGFGYGWGGYQYGWGANSRIIPYFAQHPPVYYSYPVARPYGFSPYALPPGVLPAELKVAQPEPEEIVNPYFRPRSEEGDVQPARETEPKAQTAGDRTAQRVIVNPYLAVSH